MLIALAGFDWEDKRAVAGPLAERLGVAFLDLNEQIERRYYRKYFEKLSYTRVFKEVGLSNFQAMERQTLVELENQTPLVLTLGSATLMHEETRHVLKAMGLILYLEVDSGMLFARLRADGKPRFLEQEDASGDMDTLYLQRKFIYDRCCDILLNITQLEPVSAADQALQMLELSHGERLQKLRRA